MAEDKFPGWHGTTILAVRRGGEVVVAGDGQVSLGQTVIKGTLVNNAKVCTYKDVNVELAFYSKTGTLLEKDTETIFENIAPGDSKDFKTKSDTSSFPSFVLIDVAVTE